MARKIYYWKLRSVELQLGEKTMIMGILNVTPDSFSDGGRYSDPDRAYARALELEEQGADIIDIGAESTSPGSQRVSAEEEWRRLAPVLKRLRDKLTVPLSLDTYKAETAQRAFEYGVEIVNDPSGLTFDSELAKTAANANAGLILNHMRGTPETWAKLPPLPDMAGVVSRDLEATINRARRAGVERNRIAIDPGLGFGKRREQNSELLAHLRQLAALDCPILTGPSRKSFLAQTTEPETLYATAAAVAVSVLNGAHIVRVHDVREMRAAIQVADEVARATDASQAAQAAAQAAERAVPRRTAGRESDDRPRSVMPPVARKVPRIEEAKPKEPEVAAIIEPATDSMPETQSPASVPAVTPDTNQEERKTVPQETKRDFREARPAARPFTNRPPRRDFGSSRPPAKDRPAARRDSGDRPPRRDFQDRPPRRDFGAKPPAGDRPPRREFSDRSATGDRKSRGDFSGRPPRRDSGSRPPSGDRPPRREYDSRSAPGERPQRRDFGSSGKPRGESPRRNFGDRPPRRDGDATRGKPSNGGTKRPPNRPFRKRP